MGLSIEGAFRGVGRFWSRHMNIGIVRSISGVFLLFIDLDVLRWLSLLAQPRVVGYMRGIRRRVSDTSHLENSLARSGQTGREA
jgi:hypothetical protein